MSELRSHNTLEEPELLKVATVCFEYLNNTSLEPSDFHSSLNQVQLSLKLKQKVARDFLLFFKFAGKKVLPKERLEEDLKNLGFTDDLAGKIGAMWESKRTEVVKAILSEVGASHELIDVEWKFGVTVGNKLVEDKGESFIQIKLVVAELNGKHKDIYFEVTPRQFYELYGEIEKVKTIMEIHS